MGGMRTNAAIYNVIAAHKHGQACDRLKLQVFDICGSWVTVEYLKLSEALMGLNQIQEAQEC
jgi:hypothetical protein